MTRKSGKNRHDQRDYKYQNQQRVPEAFEDIYDPIYDEFISEGDFWDDWRSVDSFENCKICYKRSSEHKTDDDDEVVQEQNYIITGTKDVQPNDQMAEEAESGWEIYHSKYVKKRIHKSVIESKRIAASSETALLASDETVVSAKQKWVDSWCHEDRKLAECVTDDSDKMIINIDGLFRKNRKAGYGVIIRNQHTNVPLLASAAVYDQGKPISYLYHELQGLNKGLELAIKYGLRHFSIVHRSRCIVPDIAKWYSYCTDTDDHVSTPNTFCKICAKGYYFDDCTDEDYQLNIYPLIQEIRDNFAMLEGSYVRSYGWVKNKYNKAADYVAKLRVNKEEMKPHEFPEELKDILYEESLNGDLISYAIRQIGYETDEEMDEECLFR